MKMPEKPIPYSQLQDRIIKEGLFKKSLELAKRYDEDYIHWDELRRKDLQDPEYTWALVKLSRMGNSYPIDFGDVELQYNITKEAHRILHILDIGASGSIVVAEPLHESEMERYIVSSLMEEAIASSQLEGAVTTTKEAKRMLREGRRPRSHSERMIVNDYVTMQRIKEMADRTLTESSILELHRLITHDTLDDPKFEGRFRQDDETVVMDPLEGTIYHQPPSHVKIPEYMEKLCAFANDDDSGGYLHPLLKAIVIHFMIGYLHPFVDGNGRLARALMYWKAMRSGYWLFEYMAVSKVIKQSRGRYNLAYLYTETDENDVTYFINFNLECMEKALENTKAYIKRKQEEARTATAIVEMHPELNFRQAEILKDFLKRKDTAVTVAEIVSKFNVVHQTARTDLLLLTKLGFLDMRKSGRKMFFLYRNNPMK
ncbi:MAG TPA: Fic family protein [Methanomassiliicoccales archaeon]|jgi:Fic family protein